MIVGETVLSASNIKYLLVLNHLDINGEGIRCTDIAEALNVSKPSVHQMMKTMNEMELVNKSKYGTVFLTRKGRTLANVYNEYYLTICAYFQNVLFSEKSDAKTIAMILISEISTEQLNIICDKMKSNITDLL